MRKSPKIALSCLVSSTVVLLGPTTVGCSRPPGSLARDAGLDAAPQADAAADAGADAAAPLRRLVEWRLYGTTPVENRFVDPTFSQVNGVSWMPFDLAATRIAAVSILMRASPTGMPVLGVASGGTQPSTVMGAARSAQGAIEVSVWMATAPGAPTPDVTLMGLYPAGESSVDLAPDAASSPVNLDGLHWVRWRAEILDGPIGWATLRVVNRDTSPLFLNGPVLVTLDEHKAGLRRWRRPRPLRPLERVALRAFWRRVKDWF